MVSMAGESIEVKDAKRMRLQPVNVLDGPPKLHNKIMTLLVDPSYVLYSSYPLFVSGLKKYIWGNFQGNFHHTIYQAIPTPSNSKTEDPNLHPIHTHVVSPKDKVEPIGSHSIPKHLPKVVSQHVLIEKSKLLRVQYANPQVLQNGGLKLGWCRVDERLI